MLGQCFRIENGYQIGQDQVRADGPRLEIIAPACGRAAQVVVPNVAQTECL